MRGLERPGKIAAVDAVARNDGVPGQRAGFALRLHRLNADGQSIDKPGAELDDKRRYHHAHDGSGNEGLEQVAADQAPGLSLLRQQEGEFADLGQAQSGKQGAADRIAEGRRGDDHDDGLDEDEQGRQGQKPDPVGNEILDHQQHADGDEENARKIVAEGDDVSDDMMAVLRF